MEKVPVKVFGDETLYKRYKGNKLKACAIFIKDRPQTTQVVSFCESNKFDIYCILLRRHAWGNTANVGHKKNLNFLYPTLGAINNLLAKRKKLIVYLPYSVFYIPEELKAVVRKILKSGGTLVTFGLGYNTVNSRDIDEYQCSVSMHTEMFKWCNSQCYPCISEDVPLYSGDLSNFYPIKLLREYLEKTKEKRKAIYLIRERPYKEASYRYLDKYKPAIKFYESEDSCDELELMKEELRNV